MKNFMKKYSILLIIIFMFFLITTESNAYYIKEFDFSRQTLKSNNIYGICKIYRDDDVFYYKKNSSGSYAESVEESQVMSLRNEIKQAISSTSSGEYLIGKILKSSTYYDETNKEFCYKRNAASVSTDMLTKVIIVGYDDEYQFKSNLSSKKGAYKVKKVGETEEFYVSYEDTWIESELSYMTDANSITLDKTSISVKVGETVEVHYTVLPENAISKGVTVSYSDGIEINTETSGTVKIKGITKGDAYIIIKLKSNKEVTAKCDIKVTSDGVSVIVPESPKPGIPSPSPSPIPDPSPSPVVPPTSIPVIPSPSPEVPPPSPEDDKITSNKYLVSTNKNYIYGILPNTKISEFKANIIANVDYKIYDEDENIIMNEGNIVSTGMKIKTANKEIYTLIVKGDINGDGKITITDVVKCNLYTVNIKVPNEIEKVAADVSEDGKITITDLVRLKLASVNIKPIG